MRDSRSSIVSRGQSLSRQVMGLKGREVVSFIRGSAVGEKKLFRPKGRSASFI